MHTFQRPTVVFRYQFCVHYGLS